MKSRAGEWRTIWGVTVLFSVDAANGLFNFITDFSFVAVAYCLKFLLLIYLLQGVKISARYLAIFLVGAGSLILGTALFTPDSTSIQMATKTVSSLLLIAVLAQHGYSLSQRGLFVILCYFLILILFSFGLGAFGWGHLRYGEGSLLPNNGYFISGNELNLVLVTSLIGSVFLFKEQKSLGTYSLLGGVLLAIIFTGSKTTILSSVLLVAPLAWGSRFRWLMAPLFLAGLLSALSLLGIWGRWEYFFNVYQESGVLSSLTNGRFARLQGASVDAFLVPGKYSQTLVESDLIDLSLRYGLLGVALYFCYFAMVWRASSGNKFIVILFAGISMLAGHVVYSVMAAPLIGITLAVVSRCTFARRSSEMERLP